jgi:hypothetical protein
VRRLLAALLGRRRRPVPPRRDPDPDRLMRVYAETHAEVEKLRRAA